MFRVCADAARDCPEFGGLGFRIQTLGLGLRFWSPGFRF